MALYERYAGMLLNKGDAKACARLLGQIRFGKPDHIGSKLMIWNVNGVIIRNDVFIDFTEGGNSAKYKDWMPPNEIWIDHDIDPSEHHAVMLHEFVEMNLMNDGMGYEAAHKVANDHETKVRPKSGWTPEQITASKREWVKLWNEQIEKYLAWERRKAA